MKIPGVSRGRGRPAVVVRRPERIAIRDCIVRCYYDHGRCGHTAGPYPNRDAAAAAAIVHYDRKHKRANDDAG